MSNMRLVLPERVDSLSITYTGTNDRVKALFRAWHRDGKERKAEVTEDEMREFLGNIRIAQRPVFPDSLQAQALMEEATRPPSDEEKAKDGEQGVG